MEKKFDVVIVGGGVIGTSLLHVLSQYTTVKNIALLESHKKLAQVNSNKKHNSQTLHFGDIETNYSYEKAKNVKKGASMVVRYLESHADENLFQKYPKMVLAVGDREVKALEERYEKIKDLFPTLRKIDRVEIAQIEPNVVKGRKKDENILALSTEDGYAVDFSALAQSFAEHAQKTDKASVFLSTSVLSIKKDGDEYILHTNQGTFSAPVVVVAAGSHSIYFAKKMGYAEDYTVFPVAGDFYHTPSVLNGKVYTVQNPKLPFAAIHGDPDLAVPDKTRWGPTAKVFPLLERGKFGTMKDFFYTFGFDKDVFHSVKRNLADRDIATFLAKNVVYDLPIVGKIRFLKEARKIVPTLKLKDLKEANGMGGMRPQIVDKKQRKMLMGDIKLIRDNIIFNMTPSPGATRCLQNAVEDAKTIIGFFKGTYMFDEKRLRHELGVELECRTQ